MKSPMVDGALRFASGYAFSSTVLARSTAGAEPSVPTLTASTPRLSNRVAGMFTAGQTKLLRFQKPNRGPLDPSSGNAAAVAPAGQRPRAGVVASCAQDTAPAGTGLAEPFPFSPRPWNVPGIDSPGSARTTTSPWTPGIARSRAVSGATDAAGPAGVMAGPTRVPAGPIWTVLFGCWSASWVVSMLTTAGVPNRVWFTASWVAMATTAAVVMSRASTRPLTAQKAALGSSARRRAAISVAGRFASRAMPRAATIVSHGPAMTRPTMISR